MRDRVGNPGRWLALTTIAVALALPVATAQDGDAPPRAWLGVTLGSVEAPVMAGTLEQLGSRWFLLRDVHRAPSLALAQSRCTLSWQRGPMTCDDLRRLAKVR